MYLFTNVDLDHTWRVEWLVFSRFPNSASGVHYMIRTCESLSLNVLSSSRATFTLPAHVSVSESDLIVWLSTWCMVSDHVCHWIYLHWFLQQWRCVSVTMLSWCCVSVGSASQQFLLSLHNSTFIYKHILHVYKQSLMWISMWLVQICKNHISCDFIY